MLNLKSIIESNFNSILLLSVIVGLFVPSIEYTPNEAVTVLLAIIMFFVSSKVDLSTIKNIPIKSVIVFYIVRFILLPIALFYLAESLIPKYAIGILLVSLVPVGVTTPMLVSTAKGNVTFALALTIVTSLLAPFMIPLIFMNMSLSSEIEISGLFITLFSIIIIPLLLYYLLTRFKRGLKPLIDKNSSFVSIAFTGLVIAIVVSKQKDVFLNDTFSLFLASIVMFLLFILFYIFGWFYPMQRDKPDMIISNSLSSGAINTAVGINLALLYFSSDTVFFLVISEFAWVASIPLFNKIRIKVFI